MGVVLYSFATPAVRYSTSARAGYEKSAIMELRIICCFKVPSLYRKYRKNPDLVAEF